MLHLQESNFYAMHNIDAENCTLSGIQNLIKKGKFSFIELSYELLENLILADNKTAYRKNSNGIYCFFLF